MTLLGINTAVIIGACLYLGGMLVQVLMHDVLLGWQSF